MVDYCQPQLTWMRRTATPPGDPGNQSAAAVFVARAAGLIVTPLNYNSQLTRRSLSNNSGPERAIPEPQVDRFLRAVSASRVRACTRSSVRAFLTR